MKFKSLLLSTLLLCCSCNQSNENITILTEKNLKQTLEILISKMNLKYKICLIIRENREITLKIITK